MKKNLRNRHYTLLAFCLLAALLFSCKGDDHAHTDAEYTCPMHPTVISDKPGACPVCGMSLVKKNGAGEEVVVSDDVKAVTRSANERVIASIPTTKATFNTLNIPVLTEGVVAYDPQNVRTVASRISGRLEKMVVKYPLQPVRTGQVVAEVYSPELVTAQKELVFLLQQDANDDLLINSAKSKLEFLGMSRSQIDDLARTKEIRRSFPIHSAHSGYVVNGLDQPTTTESPQGATTGMRGDMNESQAAAPANEIKASSAAPLAREGTYVTKGQPLFTLIKDQSLRIELSIPVEIAGYVKKGSPVTIIYNTSDSVNTRVDFVEPLYQPQQKFLTARVLAPVRELRLGQLVQGRLREIDIEGLWVPKTAVVKKGMDQVVFVKDKTGFVPKIVKSGITAGDKINILHGLASTDEIASNGQYLIDSESFIKTSD